MSLGPVPDFLPGRSAAGRIAAGLPTDADARLAMRCVLDTAARSTTGLFIYPVLWLSLALFGGWAARWPVLVWGNLAALAAVAAGRTLLNRAMPALLPRHPRAAALAFHAATLGASLHWGVLTGLSMHLAPQSDVAWVMLVTTIGFCAGGNTMFGINPAMRVAYPALMLAPVVVAEALNPAPVNLMMIVMQVVFALYLRRSSRLVHDDYWAALQGQRLAEERARELEMASLTDGLTQVPNRMHFDRQLAHEWARQCRVGGPVSLLLVDLDHFKNINDTHGHPVGDRCLQAVSQALKAGFGRATDFLARYGGEEFAVILTDTDEEGARLVAERMLAEVRSVCLQHGGVTLRLSCSIGVACALPRPGDAPARLVQRADAALYRAKRQGRDRWESDRDATAEPGADHPLN